MKKHIVMGLALSTALMSFGQGRINFTNVGSAGAVVVDAPIFDIGGTTALGATFRAELWGAQGTGVAADALSKVGNTFAFGGAYPAGYFQGAVIDTLQAAGPWTFQVRVFDSAAFGSYAAALNVAGSHIGTSAPLNVTTVALPGTAPLLAGLTSFSLIANPVPEPSVIALGVLGAMALLFRRRK